VTYFVTIWGGEHTFDNVQCMVFHRQGKSASPLGQHHLDLWLLTHRGGEADLQGVSVRIGDKEVRAAYGLDFREHTLRAILQAEHEHFTLDQRQLHL
jgi:hypothetical protein